jgi:hypothetical protein
MGTIIAFSTIGNEKYSSKSLINSLLINLKSIEDLIALNGNYLSFGFIRYMMAPLLDSVVKNYEPLIVVRQHRK